MAESSVGLSEEGSRQYACRALFSTHTRFGTPHHFDPLPKNLQTTHPSVGGTIIVHRAWHATSHSDFYKTLAHNPNARERGEPRERAGRAATTSPQTHPFRGKRQHRTSVPAASVRGMRHDIVLCAQR